MEQQLDFPTFPLSLSRPNTTSLHPPPSPTTYNNNNNNNNNNNIYFILSL